MMTTSTALATGPPTIGAPRPSAADIRKVKALVWMRNHHQRTVDQGTVEAFRRRHVPTSGMPLLERACGRYPNMAWAPEELMVPTALPPEARLATGYKLDYYGFGKLGWALYNQFPIDPDVLWDPSFEWNHAFPDKGDGWEHPTSDETYTRLRLQGPNPFLLRRTDSDAGTEPTFELDFTERFHGILPPIVARFVVRDDAFIPTDIDVGGHRHRPGDPTWDRAKQMVNAADARFAAFGRHLLDCHLIVGAAFALSTFDLPTWHRLRPFMAFFTYGTLEVNDLAYRALVSPGSYFVESGFCSVEDARHLFANGVEQFDLDQWIAPRDIEQRGIDAIPGHPYVEDATLVWPAFVEVVHRHLDDLRLDDEAIAADADLQRWYRTLAGLLPDTDPDEQPLDRARLEDLCTALLWNNVVHEICGDLGPILGSDDPGDKAILNLAGLKAATGGGELTEPVPPATMADVFLLDQARHVSGFNVGGNNILAVNAAAMIDDPKLVQAVEDLQATLRELEAELVDRNATRAVQFNRMLPRHWEASISF